MLFGSISALAAVSPLQTAVKSLLLFKGGRAVGNNLAMPLARGRRGGVRWDRFASPAPAVFSRAQEDADRSRSVTGTDLVCGAHELGVSGGELQTGKKQTITLC